MRLCNRSVAFVLLLAGFTGAATTPLVFGQEKIKVRKLDELPRHNYKVTGKVIELVKSDEAFAKLADLVRKDVEADLAKFDIEDKATLKRLTQLLMQLDVLARRDEQALKRLKLIRDLEDKPARKLTNGLVTEALVAARGEAIFEVESLVPGGQRLKFSGTSMASPNVANLAGKILAIRPDLKPAEVIALIKKGVAPVPGAKKAIPLIDPKHTLSLLKN
jgi:hypothetical protein